MLSKIFSTAEHIETRYWEIDFLRGIAIITMVISNFITDLDYFNISGINSFSGFWWFFSRATAVIFIFLVGVSLTLSYSRVQKQKSDVELRMKYIKRGLKILSWGIIITFASWFFLKENFVIFGVLHLIGLSIILAYPFLKLRFSNLLLGATFFAVGIYFRNLEITSYTLLWLGLAPSNYFSVDYLPLIPWFGFVLIGIFIGNTLYTNGIRNYKLPALENFSSIKFLSFLGRNSLFIYLIHQPILLLALKILGS